MHSKLRAKMLHGLKLALSGRGEKSILETNLHLKDADRTISELQRWFPQLQVGIEENEKAWATLSYNIRTMASNAQEIYKENHDIHHTLDALHAAGEHIVKPPATDALQEERVKSFSALRAFNDTVRDLRALQTSCVAALKNKDYYETKVETMRVNEAKKKKVSDKDVDKRLRNEHKLKQVVGELTFKMDRLERELTSVLQNKERVLEIVLSTYVLSQNYYFGRNRMQPVVSLLASRISSSPRSVRGRGEYSVNMNLYGGDTMLYPIETSSGLPPPARAPSPIMASSRVAGGVYHAS